MAISRGDKYDAFMPTIDTHLLFTTTDIDGVPTLNWRCRKTGEPVYVWNFEGEFDFSKAIKLLINESRLDPEYRKVCDLARRWDFYAVR